MISINRDKLNTLIEINNLINSNYTDVTLLLTRIIESATKLTKGDASSLLLVNPENNKLYFEIALGAKGEEIKSFSLNMGEGIAGWVAQNNTSLIVNDTEADERFFKDISKRIGFASNSILAVPMRLRDTCIGVIEIINKQNHEVFTDEDLQWLEVFATQAAIAIQNARSYQKVKEEILFLRDHIKSEMDYHVFIGESKLIKSKLEMAIKAAETDSSVLLLGESGVGKELFAEQIHLHSNRVNKSFIRVNCAAIPENLLESELFGHVKGAFTDATKDRRGRFELADEGTIFLDEIAELPLGIQAKLLRVLQNKTFEKVGSSTPIKVDVRIIAATNKDISQYVQAGKFRADLYYRLNVLPIYIPALRDRKEDIPILINFFLSKYTKELKKNIKGFTPEAMEMLLSFSWPGNVRELQNVVERAVVITQDEFIKPEALILDTSAGLNVDSYQGKDLKDAVNQFKKQFITKALVTNDWHQTKTADALGIQRTYLSRLMKELNIRKD
jgi:Nif-specific regulatory protein